MTTPILRRAVAEAVGSEKFAQPWKRETLVGSIRARTGIDVMAHRSLESLQQAMRALNGLAEGNRLVGIISHVPELREKIDRQIIVRKDRSGGSRVEVVK